MKKITFEVVKERLESYGYEVLETEYLRAKAKMRVKCSEGHLTHKTWDGLTRSPECAICNRQSKKTIEDAREIFENGGYKLISTEYVEVRVNMDVICDKGHKTRTSVDKFQQGRRCGICNVNKKKDFEGVKKLFEDKGFKMISKEYVGVHEKLNVICDAGHEVAMSTDKLIQGRGCSLCSFRKRSGINHHNWNPNLTDEERYERRDVNENKKWRTDVYKRDGYTCRKCGDKGVALNAHHIFNYSSVKAERFNINNGITFCVKCHKEFHFIYSKFNNDEWQVKEFIGDETQWNLMNINYLVNEQCP